MQFWGVDPASAIQILLSELRSLRGDGVESVSIGPEAESKLRDLLAKAKGGVGHAEAPILKGGQSADGPGPLPTTLARTPRAVEGRRPLATPMAGKPAKVGFDDSAVLTPPVLDPILPGAPVERLDALREILRACPECRRQLPAGQEPLLGFGSAEADILVVVEHPSAEEMLGGSPFIGAAGEVLAKAVQAMGIDRDRVYVAPVLRWRPVLPTGQGGRPASAREIAYCLPYLRAQVEILGPKVILAFGNVPLNALAGGDEPLRVTQVRGTWREVMGIPMMPTFHPSYLLHNPAPKVKRDFWEDLLAVMERLGLPVSERQRGYFR